MSNKYVKSYMLIILGVVIGALVFWQIGPHSYPAATAKEPAAVAPATPIMSMQEMNNTFVDISENASPAVVTVFTDKVLKYNRAQNPFFFNSPFDQFFGDFFGQQQQPRQQAPQEREYHQRGMGSGVIISQDGYILTNNHVIENADTIQVRLAGKKTYPARVIGADPKTDIALIKIEANNLTTLRVGDSDRLQVGEWVLAIGSPLSENLDHTVTAGIVSAKGRSNLGLADYEDFIQTDAAINPGNSGGALVNMNGDLVGINAAIVSQNGGFQGIGFAVPINMAKQVMESLLEHGTVVRGYLGVYIQDIDETMAKALDLPEASGALVSDVAEDGPGAKAGLKQGDVIIALNDDKISSSTELRNTIASMAPGAKIELTVLRDGKRLNLETRLEKLKSDEMSASTEKRIEKKLGFDVVTVNKDLADKYNLDRSLKGVVITQVRSEEVYRSGLKEGDLIISVNKKTVNDVDEFSKAVTDLNKGDAVMLRVVRQDRAFFVAFTV